MLYNPSIIEIIQKGKVLNHKEVSFLWLVCGEWGPIGPYETDLSDYVAGSTKFNKLYNMLYIKLFKNVQFYF